MRLAPDWSAVLRRAWSVRFIAAAFVFSVLEISLPMLDGYVDVPPRLFALLTGLSAGGAFVTRLLAQSNLGGRP